MATAALPAMPRHVTNSTVSPSKLGRAIAGTGFRESVLVFARVAVGFKWNRHECLEGALVRRAGGRRVVWWQAVVVEQRHVGSRSVSECHHAN